MKNLSQAPGRREFLQTLGGGALSLALAGRAYSAGTKPMRGVFPIGQTPVTESDKLDLECLQNEVKFCNRYKVHGFAGRRSPAAGPPCRKRRGWMAPKPSSPPARAARRRW